MEESLEQLIFHHCNARQLNYNLRQLSLQRSLRFIDGDTVSFPEKHNNYLVVRNFILFQVDIHLSFDVGK